MKKIQTIWFNSVYPFQVSLDLLNKRDRIRFWCLVLAQMSTGLLDLFGAALVSLVAILLISAFQDSPRSQEYSSLVFQYLPVNNITPIQLAVVVGVCSAIFFIIKSVLSIVLLRKNLQFLGNRHTQIVNDLLEHLLRKNLLFVEGKGSQEVSYALLQGTSYLTIELLAPLAIGLSEGTLLILFALLLFFIDPFLMMCVVFFFGFVGILLHRVLGGWALEVGEEVARAGSVSTRRVQEILANFRTIKILGREKYFLQDTKIDVEKGTVAHATRRFIEQIPKFTLEVTLILGILALGFSQMRQQDLTTSSLTIAIFLTVAVRSTPSMLRLQSVFVSIRNATGQAKETILFIEKLRREPDYKPNTSIFESSETQCPVISVSKIDFTYPTNSEPTLRDLSFDLMENESLAIVGQSGAGKSTLMDIILGLLTPQYGSVKINGIDPALAISKWKNQVVYVPQETKLLSKTIAQNVAFGISEEELDEDRVWSALKAVQLYKFVKSLPYGLGTQIGETGINLSGGQKQRIGLSRAVYLEPKILFLDEATSALDSTTETQISSTIQAMTKNTTVVVIAHRLATVQSANWILYLEKGQPGVFGKYSDVSTRCEGFAAQTNFLSKLEP